MYFSTAVILFLIIVDILVYCFQQQQPQQQHDKNNVEELKNPSLSASLSDGQDHGQIMKDPSSSSQDHHCRRFSLDEIRLATHDFDDAFVIGKGGFGMVYKGKLNFNFGQETDVAIKRSNRDSDQGAIEFWAEIEMLSKFRHSHVVSLLGYCEGSGTREMILVYEYMPNGSLDDHLHRKRVNGSNSSALTWVQRLHICIGAARGLDYLHTGTGVLSRVIHRDVKSSNILLDENWSGKMSDFGLSRTSPAYQLGSTTNVYTGMIRGTFGYMDAEYFSTHRVTRKTDVYAFGVVLLEVLCGRPALDFRLDEQQHSLAGWAKQCIKEGKIDRIIDSCLRGQVEGNCLKEFGKIAYECLHNCSKDRPTMTKVLARLEFVLAWTLRIHTGRTTFVKMARTLFLTKPIIPMSSGPKQLEQSNDNKRKNIITESHGTTAAEVGCNSGGSVTASREGVQHSGETPVLKEFKLSELESATMDFTDDRFIGKGGFGKVFKGWLDGVTFAPQMDGVGLAVAIKKSDPKSDQGLKEWQTEVNFLGKFSHPNVVKLLGHCQENEKFLLVYEYMQNGSLEDHIFKNLAEPLPWYTRIKIALGTAKGIAFLHTTENNAILRDVKPSNILLDQDFNVKLSDFGLVRVGPVDGESYVSTLVKGTYGYGAPEYVATGRLYMKSDVYGFGVMMLEMITGLRVLDTKRTPAKRNLVEWAKPFLNNEKKLYKIMDPQLNRDYPSKGACKAAKLILSCLVPDPSNRPSMEEIVTLLQVISAIKMKPR